MLIKTIKLSALFPVKISRIRVFIPVIFATLMTASFAAPTDYTKLTNLAVQRYGENARKTFLDLQTLVNKFKDAKEEDKLREVNEFINARIRVYDDDMSTWGVPDYWATPLESLGKEHGDCEDYTIAKYVILRDLGVPNEKLKLTYVSAQIGGAHSKIFQAHMVLVYYPEPGADPLVLDNLIADLRNASRRRDLVPIYSFNSEGLWLGSAPQGDSSEHLSRWKDVLARIKADGIDITK